MINAIRDEISTWVIKPLHSSLFGSAARGGGGPESDLDVLVVRPGEIPENDWEEQKYASGLNLKKKIGNNVSWFDISLAELTTAKRASEPIFSEWGKDGISLTEASLLNLLSVSKSKAQK